MEIYELVPTAIYTALTVGYIWTSTGNNFKARAVNKIVMTAMFFLFGIAVFIYTKSYLDPYRWFYVLGLTLCFCGDVILLWSFGKGGATFSLGNMALLAYVLLYASAHGVAFSQIWWFLPIFAVFFGVDLFMILTKRFNCGKGSLAIGYYLATVISHATASFALAVTLPCTETILMSVGMALFMVSDFFLISGKFYFNNTKKWPQVIVTLSYYPGLWLIALSLAFAL